MSLELHAEVDQSRWITIPPGMPEPQRGMWLEFATRTAQAAAAHWDRPSDELVPDMVAHALDVRGEHEGLVLQYWPPVVPGAVLVRVEVQEAPDARAAAAELQSQVHAHVEQFPGAALGPGYEWLHSAPLPGESEDMLVGTQYLFMGGRLMVLVTLEATLPDLFTAVIDEVRTLVRSIRLTVDGADWRSEALPGEVGTRADLERWPTLDEAS